MKASEKLKLRNPEMSEMIDFAVDKFGEPDEALGSAAGGFKGLPNLHTDPGAKKIVAGVRQAIKDCTPTK